MKELIQQYISESIAVKRKLAEEQADILSAIAEKFIEVIKAGGTIYFCGNGGSASDAQHVVTELIGRFLRDRKAFASVCLSANIAAITAIANDYGYQEVFSRQVQGLVTNRDIVVGISTSGGSANIIKAIQAAKEIGAFTVSFSGDPGEPLSSQADQALAVASKHTPHIQEAHITAWHVICQIVEQEFL